MLNTGGVVLLVAAVLGLPFLFGWMLSTRWRMPEYFGKISLILLCLFASVAILATGTLELGIDLRGGVILVYEIESARSEAGPEGAAQEPQAVDMDKLIAALSRRVNPAGYKEVKIRQFGPKQVEIIVPEVDEERVARLERIISSVGTLEFRILANRKDHESEIRRAEQLPEDQIYLRDASGRPEAWWVPIAAGQEDDVGPSGDVVIRERVFRGEKRLAVLVVQDPYNVNGGYLVRAAPGVDDEGKPAVNFTFNAIGGQKFGDLTSDNAPDRTSGFRRRLGIILDGEMYSAPSIESPIFERGIIKGGFTNERVRELVDVLNAGSLPATLHKEPISRLYTGPTLGRDTIQRGLTAVIVSLSLVFLAVMVYYRFAGLVACAAMAMNLVMLLACMIVIGAQLTLPGLAGLALSIAMAVDANVLIYERMREEQARGSTLRMTIRNGFSRALSAIIDSNITTLITAAILYAIGTDLIRGFAVTLFLGLVLSLFTAIFCARVVFDIAERQRWITRVNMMRSIGETRFDFLRQQWVMIGASCVVIILGLVATWHRGQGILDIDFTGGVSLELVFKEPHDVGTVRQKLGDLQDLTVTDVQYKEEKRGLRFVINTSSPPDVEVEEYLNRVKQIVQERFPGKLATNTVTIESFKPVRPTTASVRFGGPTAGEAVAVSTSVSLATSAEGEADSNPMPGAAEVPSGVPTAPSPASQTAEPLPPGAEPPAPASSLPPSSAPSPSAPAGPSPAPAPEGQPAAAGAARRR